MTWLTTTDLVCVIAPLLIGVAIMAPLTWWLASRHGQRPPIDATEAGILYLTEAAQRALGRCASPGKLRAMTPDAIRRHLNRSAHFFSGTDPMPSPSQYETWPKQAQFLCDGDYVGLRSYQAELIEAIGNGVIDARSRAHSQEWISLLLALASIALLTLACVLAWAATERRCFAGFTPLCKVATPSPRPKWQITLGSEELFEFDSGELVDERAAYLEDKLSTLFSRFSEIEIVKIFAFTDPIGTIEHNRSLSERRAAAVRGVIERVRNDSRHEPIEFREPLLPQKHLGPPRNRKLDVPLFEYCIRERLLDPPTAAIFKFGPRPEEGAEYPFRAVGEAKGRGWTRYPAKRTNKFWTVVNCLAPMRRVEIAFRGVLRDDPEPNAKPNDLEAVRTHR